MVIQLRGVDATSVVVEEIDFDGHALHPKYKRADGTVVECKTWWCKVYVNGQAVRMNTHQTNPDYS